MRTIKPINVVIQLKPEPTRRIDELRLEWGINSRGQVIERLIDEIFEAQDTNNK